LDHPRITIIGAGNLATRLAVALYEHGFCISRIYSRTADSAKTLAAMVDTDYTTEIPHIGTDSDIYIFSVKDDALPGILKQLPPLKGLLVHTGGSIPMDIFAPYSDSYGVFYPLQTFSKTRKIDFAETPVCIEASGEKELKQLAALAESISRHVLPVNSDRRKYIHLAAVFTCNFVNRMYDIGAEILQQQQLPFDLLQPLIDETAAKIHSLSPFEAQTGPAVRYDRSVTEKQSALLNDESLKTIYELMSKNIHQRHLSNR